MFPHGYFAAAYFAPGYFPPAAGGLLDGPDPIALAWAAPAAAALTYLPGD